ncbi:MAG: maleylpyruvate isomerase family mycothiol-dependent enzyme [Candidatus Nanopelagicales bacterium]
MTTDRGPSLDGTRLRPERYQELLDLDFEALVAAAQACPEAVIPSCPGWTMRDLVSHMVGVYRHKAATIDLGEAPPDRVTGGWGDLDPDRDPIEQLREAHTQIRQRLLEHSIDDPAYTFWPPEQTVGFWVRRMPQETAVHRWDAQAAGESVPAEIAEDLALDGVDELLGWLAWDWGDEEALDGATEQQVVISSGVHSWTVTVHPTQFVIAGGIQTDEPDAWITGPAHDLLLYLWGRGTQNVVESGDREALDLVRARLHGATS